VRSGRFKHGDQLSWQGGTRRDLHVAGAVAANGDRSKEGIRFDLSLFLRDFSVVKKIGKNRRSLNPPRNLATAEIRNGRPLRCDLQPTRPNASHRPKNSGLLNDLLADDLMFRYLTAVRGGTRNPLR
jgi:hypothetical protein